MLHDQLYSGLLAAELRQDIPYLPHITIGDHAEPRMLAALDATINARPIAIAGRITHLDVLAIDAHRIATYARIPLQAAP